MTDHLEIIFGKIRGKKINSVSTGESSGSVIILNIGDQDEYCLFVYCVWRLEGHNVVLTGWNESNSIGGNLVHQVRQLEGDRISSVGMTEFYDLKIKLESGKCLTVFCDVTPHYETPDYDENWSIYDIRENGCLSISRNFQIIGEKFRNESSRTVNK
jgi:hypothetical protein